MDPNTIMAGQLGRLPVAATDTPTAPFAVPLMRPIEISRDPLLARAQASMPGAEMTDVIVLQRAEELAGQIEQLAQELAPAALDQLIRALLIEFDGPVGLVNVVHHYFAVVRAGQPGASVAVERQAEAVALAALESWAAGIVAAWTRSTYQVALELELVADRRIETAIANGTLGALLEATANMTDAASVLVTARLLEARAPTLDPRVLAEARAFIAFAHGPDVETAIALLDAAGKARALTANLLAALATG